MLGALLGACLAIPAGAQTVEYYFNERGDTINEPDAAAATVFWYDTLTVPQPQPEDRRWHYTAGYITEYDAQDNPHKRLVVYKYDADLQSNEIDPENPAATVTFPETGSPAGQHAATGMVIDTLNGVIYVCGYTTIETDGDENGANLNYVVIKYDMNLTPQWTTLHGNHKARIYNGTGNGEDKAVSIATDGNELWVTGTSYGGATNLNDIVTLYLDCAGGAWSTEWSALGGEALGVRRFHGGHGDDTAAEVGFYYVTEQDGYRVPVIVGSSYRGTTNQIDLQVLHYGDDGSLTGGGGWKANFDNSTVHGNDHGTGLGLTKNENHGLTGGPYVCGHTEMDSGPVTDVDFVTKRLDSTGATVWSKVLDWNDGLDYAADIQIIAAPFPQEDVHVWVTGRSQVSGAEACATVVYDDEDSNGATELGWDQYQFSSGLEARGEAISIEGDVCVAGRAKSGVTDHDVLVIRYSIDPNPQMDPPYLIREWVVRHPGGTETGFDAATCINGDGAGDVFCGGQMTQNSYGADFMIMRINE